MTTFLSRTLFILGCLLAVVRPSGAQSACCSLNHFQCISGTSASPAPTNAAQCKARSATAVWFPSGPVNANSCVKRFVQCQTNAQCCGTTICETGYMTDYKMCRDAATSCKMFNTSDYCSSRAACAWDSLASTCIPSFDPSIYSVATKPPSKPDPPSCCSSSQFDCLSTVFSYEACVARGPTSTWFPEGLPANKETCTRKWTNACTTNAECCGNSICEGTYANPDAAMSCRDASVACPIFNTTNYCNSRSACRWDVTSKSCKPSFNTTFYEPGLKPVTKPLAKPCCSHDHLTCKRRFLTTPEDCAAYDPTFVWLPSGEGPGSNKANCVPRFNNLDCRKNEDCCGNMVCSKEGFSKSLKCRHPALSCPTFTPLGSKVCGEAPGCKWDGLACVPGFDTRVYDAALKATVRQPGTIKSAVQGNPDSLGLCTGFVGSLTGDPHFSSFDKRTYDCQGTGAFVIVKADGQLEIQGLFEKAGPGAASVTRGIAIEYPALADVPRIQVSIAPKADVTAPTSYMINDFCAAHIYLDGVLQTVSRNSHLSNDGSYAMLFNAVGGVDIQFFDTSVTPSLNSTSLRIRVGGSPNDKFGCSMSTWICLPLNDPTLRSDVVGLLGTPNGNREDDWTTPSGEVLPIVPRGPDSFAYCTTHYCVETAAESLFKYDSNRTFLEQYSCASVYPGEPVLEEAPPEILAICGEDAACLLDGINGGPEEAIRNLEGQEVTAEIVSSPVIQPVAEFNITIPPEEPCKWPKPGLNTCPGDVTLIVKPNTQFPLFVQSPITIVSQKGDTVTFNISNPFSDPLKAMYYSYANGVNEECLAKTNVASCMVPVPVTLNCNAGRNATHQATLKYALIDFFMVDPTAISPADNTTTIPKCCQPDPLHATTNTALYTFKIYCESSCPLTTPSRRKLNTKVVNRKLRASGATSSQ